jgi:hypothetical protein
MHDQKMPMKALYFKRQRRTANLLQVSSEGVGVYFRFAILNSWFFQIYVLVVMDIGLSDVHS